MLCEYFNQCGGCNLPLSYDEQLEYKVKEQKEKFIKLYDKQYDIIQSEQSHFRNRVEFRLWKIYDDDNNFILSYAMNDINKKILPIKQCPISSKIISNIMPKLIEFISLDEVLHHKCFSCEFLSSTTNDILVTLIYHKKLDEDWITKAKELEKKLNIKIIGRSRKQKIILSDDFINEELNIDNKIYKFQYKEGGFTQPNQNVNKQMISWVLNNIQAKDDLCELYCGGGNFTIPLSGKFNQVLATEISKTSIKSAKQNCTLNNINNISFIRMSSEEFVQALEKQRIFRRLEIEQINLDNYNFSTIFVDPPRAGLDEVTINLVKTFKQIIYISCNPDTLKRDLEILTKTHKIEKFAFFDQFAYTKHIECGVIFDRL